MYLESTKHNIILEPQPEPPTEETKQITVHIKRSGTSLKITTTLPEGMDGESLCKWKFVNSNDPLKPIVKSCMATRGRDCNALPRCKEFTIEEVDDLNDYHLTVYHGEDETIMGGYEIEKGYFNAFVKS